MSFVALVEQGDEEPLVVIAGIEGPADSGWFDTVEDIASSLGFGGIAPNPIASVPAGQAELPLLGGIRIELREETVVSQVLEGFGLVPLGTPDRGLLMIAAQAFDNDEATFTSVLAATQAMLDSLAFVDLG